MLKRFSGLSHVNFFEVVILSIIVLIPVAYSFQTRSVFLLPKELLFKILTSFLLVLWIYGYFRKSGKINSELNKNLLIPVTAFICFIAVTALTAEYGFLALEELFTVVFMLVLLLVSSSFRYSRDFFVKIVFAFFVVGVMESFLGYVQFMNKYGSPLYPACRWFLETIRIPVECSGVKVVMGTLGNKNYFGGFMAFLVPPLFVFSLLVQNNVRKILSFLFLFLIVLVILISGNRSGILGMSFSFIVVYVLLFASGYLKTHIILKRVMAITVFSIVAGGILFVFSLQSGFEFARSVYTIFDVEHGTNRQRLFIWQSTMNMITSSPLTGLGLGSFKARYPHYQNRTYSPENALYGIGESRVDMAHNDYLHFGSETGLIGLGLFLWIIIVLFRIGISKILREKSPFVSVMKMGLLAGMTACLVDALFGFPFHLASSYSFFFLFGGMMVSGTYNETDAGKISERHFNGKYRIILTSVLALVVLFLFFGFSGRLTENLFYKQGLSQSRESGSEKSVASYKKALLLNRSNSAVMHAMGNELFRLGRYEEARDSFELALKSDPFSYTFNSLGLTYVKLKKHKLALKKYKEAIRNCPMFETPYTNLGLLYMTYLKKPKHARDQFYASLRVTKKLDEAYYYIGGVYQQHMRDYDAAEKAYRKALKANPKNAYVYYALGVIKYNLGEYDEAVELWRKAIKYNPRNKYNQYIIPLIEKHEREKQKEQGTGENPG